MKHHHTTRLHSQEQEQTVAQQQAAQTQTVVEFATADNMIRHDAEQTEVPPAVADRLQESLKHEAPPPRGWWKRLFGR
jgi:hypothetical protein